MVIITKVSVLNGNFVHVTFLMVIFARGGSEVTHSDYFGNVR